MMPSAQYRGLLLEYLRLQSSRPSLLHSLVLSLALKFADAYPDFRLPAFVDMRGVNNLRSEDFQRQHDDKERTFHSLAERLGACMLRYMTSHADEMPSDEALRLALEQAGSLGFM